MQTEWSALIAKHNHTVVLALLSHGFRIHQARDIAHDAWAKLFEARHAGKLATFELPGLAIRQALFLAADLRRELGRPAIPLESACDLLDLHATPETRLEWKQQLARTETAAAGLSERTQKVFATVLDNPDVPHALLAQRLGLSLQRLRQTLCEARARLKGALEETP